MFHLFDMTNNQEPELFTHALSGADENEPEAMTQARQVYNLHTTHHFFIGDESTVELFNALKELALQRDHEYFGILELHPEYETVLTMLKLLVDSVPELPGKPAQNAIHWMEDMHPNCWMAWQRATFYLSGGETLIKEMQTYLFQKAVSHHQIRIVNF